MVVSYLPYNQGIWQPAILKNFLFLIHDDEIDLRTREQMTAFYSAYTSYVLHTYYVPGTFPSPPLHMN
jgi:hypothetical protein